MTDRIINIIKNRTLLPFNIVTAALLLFFLYAGFSGWKFFGKTTENWAPDGHGAHHSSGHRSHHYLRTHK